MMGYRELDQRITIQQATITRDTYGAEIQTWTNFLPNIAAAKKHQSSREFYSAQKINSEMTDLFKVYFGTGRNTTTKMRVNYNGKYYDILGADDPDGRREWVYLLCKVVE
jgi:SPP1 family predicted phage head-tail adaptor